MWFREKIHKRTHVTNDRRADMDSLISSNLIGLKLSDNLDVEAAKRRNEMHVRTTARRKVTVEIFDVDVDETENADIKSEPIPEEMQAKVMKAFAEPVDGLHAQEKKFTQNFAILTAYSPIGNRTVIHGREIFSPDAARKYFADGSDKEHFAYEDFSEAAKQKIRALLSPESLQSRMEEYVTPQNMVDYLKYYLEWLKEEIPGFKMPDIPEINEANYLPVTMQIASALEKQGIELGERTESALFPSESHIAKVKQKLLSFAVAKLDDAVTELEADEKSVKHFKAALTELLEKNGYDPEIVSNFTAGVRVLPDISNQSLETIIHTGLEKRVEERLRTCAAQIANPYDAKFVEAEKMVADTLVHSVQPRVLRNIQRRKSAVLVSDGDNLGVFQDVLRVGGSHWLGVAGKYDPKFPFHANHANDFVLLTAPELDYKTLGLLARHECEHHRDFTQNDVPPYAAYYKDKLGECMAEDRQHLRETLELLENTTSQSPAKDVERIKKLAMKRGGYAEQEIDDFSVMRRRLLDDVKDIRQVVRLSFLPDENEKAHECYDLGYAQRVEVPAVIEHLKGQYGSAFIKELMPRMCESVAFHRAQSNTLRDSAR